MVYMRPSNQELIDRVNARLGIEKRAPDDPLAGPIRMKTPGELPGYTQETPGQESARLAGEYNRAGSNARTIYGEISDVAAAPLRGVYDSAMTLGSIAVDPIAAGMGYGTPVTNQIVQDQRLAQQGGEGWGDSLIRNVVSSVVTNTTAAIGGTVASFGNPVGGVAAVIGVNAIPTAMQQYQIGREEGLTELQSGIRAASYGAVAGSVSAILEKILPGMTSATTARFAKGLADDVAMPLARSIFGRLSRTANSEGVEEAVQNVANQFIDRATTQITGNSNLEKPYASIQERLMDVAQAYGMGAAAGGLVQGGLELTNTRRAIQEIGQQSVQQQPQAPAAPVAPTPMQPEMPVAPVAPVQQQPAAPAAPGMVGVDSGVSARDTLIQAAVNATQASTNLSTRASEFLSQLPVEIREQIATYERGQWTNPQEQWNGLAAILGVSRSDFEMMGFLSGSRGLETLVATARQMRPLAPAQQQSIPADSGTIQPTRPGDVPIYESVRDRPPVSTQTAAELAKELAGPSASETARKMAAASMLRERPARQYTESDDPIPQADPSVVSRELTAAPETITADWFRGKIAEFGDDIGKASGLLSGMVQQHLDNGGRVAYITEGKPRQIVATSNGLMQERDGTRWGTMSLATDNSGGYRVYFEPISQQSQTPEDLRPSQDVTGPQESPDAPKEVKVAAVTTRAFLTEITPEQKQAIAAMPTPSRSAFAKILGVEPNQLPDVVKSDNGRKAAKALAVYDTQNPDVEQARVGGRGTVMPRREGEEIPRVNTRNPGLKSFGELNRNNPRFDGTTPSSRTSPDTNSPVSSYPTPTPRPIPLDAPPVTETYEQGGTEILNPTGAGDVMARAVPTGKVTNVRMASNPGAEDASVVEISNSLDRLTEKLTGSKTPRGEGGFTQGQGDESLEGYHRRSSKSIRMKSWSDMPVAAHELAHSIWRFSDVLRWKKDDPRKNRIQSEFVRLGSQMYPDGNTSLQTREGFSEAVRLLVQEGDAKTAQKAPVFTKWFKERLAEKNPEALAELENAQRLANTFWRDMGAQQRAASQQRGVSGTIAQSIEAMRQARMSAVDWLWSSRKVFADIDLTVEKVRGVKTEVGKRLMDAVRVFSGGTALAKYWFDTNQTDGFMGIVGPSMKKILSALTPGEQEAKFWTYMYARRTIAVADPASLAAVNVYRQWVGMDPINPRETGLSVADARQIMAEVESGSDWDTIQQVSKEFDTFNKNTLKYMVQVAPGVFESQAIAIDQIDPGAWIPLRRDITLSDFAFRQARGTGGPGQSVGWKFRGSGMPIKNILASVLTETERRVERANKQAVVEAMLNLVIDRDGSRPLNGLGEYIQVLDSPTRDTFEFNRDGKKIHVLLNTRVQRVIGAMNQTDRDALNVVMRMVYGGLRTSTQMVTMMRLALNPTYVFLNRPLGNFIDAVFKTPASMGATGYKETAEIGATSIKRFFTISAESFAQAAFGKTISPESAKYLDYIGRAALEYNVGIRGDELEAARVGRAIGRGPMRDERDMVGWLDSHIDWLKNLGRQASDVAESSFMADQAVAAAAYLDANPEVKAKLERGESLTMAEISAMKETVTDVTGDAADDPLIGKALNRVGMFLPSVGVRYTKSGVRAFKKNPAVILKLGLPLAAIVVLKELWKLHEDEDYRKWALQNPNQAVRYTAVEVGGKQVLVPNYTELGLTFVGLPRAIAMAMYTADPTAAGAWVTAMIGNLMPTGEVPAISFAWQQGTGTDRFGKPIVSEYSDKPAGYTEASSPRDRIAEEQYTDRTNPIAKVIAQTPGAVIGRENLDDVERYMRKLPVVGPAVAGTMNMMRSPMRVEHLMNFWTGGSASKLNDIAQGRRGVENMVVRTEDKGTMSRPGEMGTDFYATLDRLNKREADKSKPLSKEDEQGLKLLNAANEAIAAQRRLRMKATDRNGEKAVASAMSLVADNAMRDLKAGKYEVARYKAAKRATEVELARIDGDEAEVNKLIYNGIDGVMRAKPLVASRGKTMAETTAAWNEERAEAQAFREALDIPKAKLLEIARNHLQAAKKTAKETVGVMAKLNAALR